jgi:hypothetical protein
MNYHLYDKLRADHRQELQNEVVRNRLLVRSSRRSGLGRRAIGKLGVALVTVGLKLERFDYSRQLQPYPSLSSPVQR